MLSTLAEVQSSLVHVCGRYSNYKSSSHGLQGAHCGVRGLYEAAAVC